MSDEAKRAMVNAAEAMMAERGIAAVSLAQVQAAAGQRNKSAAHYHFGTRAGLVDAILETRTRPIDEHRLAILAALEADGHRRDLRALSFALVEPLVAATISRNGRSYYARFLAHGYRDPELVRAFEQGTHNHGMRRWRTLVTECLDGLAPSLVGPRLDRVVWLVIVTAAAWESGEGEALPLRARTADLVDACMAMLQAPVSPETAAALGADD